jgi:hypothetical protein
MEKNMKTTGKIMTAASIILAMVVSGFGLDRQEVVEQEFRKKFIQRFGMRLGFAQFLPNSGNHGKDWQTGLNEDGIYPRSFDAVSQFGFQLESRFGGFEMHKNTMISALVLFSGFNYGVLIPEACFNIGWRMDNGLEFGGGPDFTVNRSLEPGFAWTVGYSSRIGKLIIPVNVRAVQSKSGFRFSLLSGFDW